MTYGAPLVEHVDEIPEDLSSKKELLKRVEGNIDHWLDYMDAGAIIRNTANVLHEKI